MNASARVTLTIAFAALAAFAAPARAQTLLNASYDPTRELYAELNAAFARQWTAQGKPAVKTQQSHGGSGAQARAVIDGLDADVVTLALAYDIDAIQQSGLINAGWPARLPQNSAPYTSTIVFLVLARAIRKASRTGATRQPGISVITPNPEDVGRRPVELPPPGNMGSVRPAATRPRPASCGQLDKHVPVLDLWARGATNTFAQRGIGDVLSPGRTRYRDQGNQGAGRHRRAVVEHPRGAAGRDRRQGCRQERHARSGRGTSSSSIRRRDRRSRRSITIGRAIRRSPRSLRVDVHQRHALHD